MAYFPALSTFLAYLGAPVTVPAGQSVLIPMDTIRYDPSETADLANSGVTVDKEGIYTHSYYVDVTVADASTIGVVEVVGGTFGGRLPDARLIDGTDVQCLATIYWHANGGALGSNIAIGLINNSAGDAVVNYAEHSLVRVG